MSKFYVIDGNSLLFRCFYSTFRPGLPLMQSKDGTPTNAIYGFAQMIGHIRKELKDGDRMIVCFDTGHPTFRSQEIEAYKAQRKPIEPALKTQIPMAHELLDKMGIEHAEMLGYEGDDVAGSLAKLGQKKGDEVTLFTSDKDFLQLLDDHIQIHALKKGLTDVIEYTKDNVAEKFGCRADQIVDFKALAGDPSDNYKGVPGIGDKTAFKLLSEYNHLEDILEAYKDDEKTSVGKKLNAGGDEGRICLKIATIITDLNVEEFYDKALIKHPDLPELKGYFKKLDLVKYASSIDKLIIEQKQKSQMTIMDVVNIEGGEEQSSSCIEYPKEKVITDITDMDSNPISVSVVLDKDIVDWNENINKIFGFILMSEKKTIYFLKAELANSAKAFKEWLALNDNKDSLDSKSMYVCCDRLNLKCGLFSYDFLLASYLINSDKASDLKDALGQLDVELELDPIKRIVQSVYLMDLKKKDMVERLTKENQIKLLTDVELPLAKTLASMEIEGMPIDLNVLSSIGDEYKKTLADIDNQIFEYVGDKNFNINSPAQVADVLFNKLGLQREKGEKGASFDVLNKHLYDHPVVSLILQHRMYSKIINGYIDSLPKHVLKDGKIHSIIHQTLTSTGRLSMSDPNLQNISIRKEEGKELRKAFFYDDSDYEFLSFDYSQIELRVMAALGNIKGLKEVCSMDEDIHKATASKVFGVPVDEVSGEMRRKAKTVNFGIVYGISAFGLAERLGCTRTEAKNFIEQFKKAFEGIDEYQNKEIQFAKENGYVVTVMNRRRYFPDINSSQVMLRKFSERAAINASIQGSAADLIKVAMNKVYDALKGKKTKIILQIHDELVFKLYKPEAKELMILIPKIMDSAMDDLLDVKLQVEGETGHSWYDCK